MNHLTLATAVFERYAKTTQRAVFLAEMERVVPWSALSKLIEPLYPKPGNGRPPVGVERKLRISSCSAGSICPTRQWKRRSALFGLATYDCGRRRRLTNNGVTNRKLSLVAAISIAEIYLSSLFRPSLSIGISQCLYMVVGRRELSLEGL